MGYQRLTAANMDALLHLKGYLDRLNVLCHVTDQTKAAFTTAPCVEKDQRVVEHYCLYV